MIHKINKKWTVALFSRFCVKIWILFFTTWKSFFLEVLSYSQQQEHSFFQKTVLVIFEIFLHLIYQQIFLWQSLNILKIFNTWKHFFWKKRKPFQKEHRFFVEIFKTEKTAFPNKTALPAANVGTNRMGGTKWTYHKEQSFASHYFIYLFI